MIIVPIVVWFTISYMFRVEQMGTCISHVILPLDIALRIWFIVSHFDIGCDYRVRLEVLITTIEVIQHHVRIDLDTRFVHHANHLLQFRTTAIACFNSALLFIIAEVIMVVDAIAAVIDTPIALCGNGRPQAADACSSQFGCNLAQMIPPSAILCLFIHRHIPIERLHHHVVKQSRLLILHG